MRIVKWSPQERVDTPDLTAMSYLVLGEFRRVARGALLGAAVAQPNYILNGFEVEPAAVPDATIRVRLDISGVLSHAFGAELIGSRVDYGQVVGGDDSNDNTEGNATQTLDFTGDPASTYTVQMRFEYTDGTLDNRAFWNPTGNTEFIAAVNTRTLPTFQLRKSGAPSNEWIDLADVVWNGAGPITTAEITDLRNFALEGVTPWQQTTKLGSGGIADFSRSTDRAANGLNAVYPALRGLARQIQDIKGADDSGNWNWWNDPYLPFDPSATLTRDQTTNLRSLRTVHFTVGDGVNTFGDFNGYTLGTGLDECLSHIETEQNNMVCRVVVQLLINGDQGNDSFQVGNYAFSQVLVEIRGGAANPSSLGGNPDTWLTSITPAGTLTTPVFECASIRGGIVLRDLFFEDGGADAEIIRSTVGTVEAYNCTFGATGTALNPTIELQGSLDRVLFENCRFNLDCYVFLSASVVDANGVFSRCTFTNAPLVLDGASHFAFTDCEFTHSVSGGVGSIATIDDSERIWFRSSRFIMSGTDIAQEADLVRLVHTNGPIRDIWFLDNYFSHSHSGTIHSAGAGANGANGTGWHIYFDNTLGTGGDEGRNIVIRGNTFRGSDVADAGAIHFIEVNSAIIEGNEITGFDISSSAGGIRTLRLIQLSRGGLGEADIRIANNTLRNWTQISGVVAARSGIFISLQTGGIITGNQISSPGTSSTARAIEIFASQNIVISSNFIEDYTSAFTGTPVYLSGCSYCTVTANAVQNCQRLVTMTGAGAGHVVSANTVDGVGSTPAANGVIEVGQAGCTIQGNVIRNYSGTANAIRLNTSGNAVVMGNIGDGTDTIVQATIGAHVGYNEAQNVNSGFTYT